MRSILLSLPVCAACGGPVKSGDTGPPGPNSTDTGADTTDTDTDTSSGSGACGDVTQYDMTLLGAVALASGGPAVGAAVRIEDRGWAAQVEVLGTATTGADGTFTLPITGLTSVEGCWGTLLDYVVVAELGEQRGEAGVNTPLYNAILDGTLVADISAAPIPMTYR